MIMAAIQNQFAEVGPFSRAQLETARRKWIAASVFFEFETGEAKRGEDVLVDVGDGRSSIQFPPQDFVENLKVTRPVSERQTRRSDNRQLNCDRVAIVDRIAVQVRVRLDPVGLIQQLPNRDMRPSRIVFPFRDRVRDAVVEFD